MRRCVPPLAALLLGSLALGVPFAFSQPLSYPDRPDYEAFRRAELETLAAISQEDPRRALTFRLLLSQRRLRETQLMVIKQKFDLVPPTLEAYGEAVKGFMEALQTFPRDTLIASGAYQSAGALGHRQQKLIQRIARRIPQELNPAVEAALDASQQLRLITARAVTPQARQSTESLGGKHSATIEEPLAPEEALSEDEGVEPLGPAATPKEKFLQPAGPPPRRPEQSLGRRLRDFEPRVRGTRRPETTHPRPRSRERD